MSQFYITLPSDASSDVYPDNTVANYTTKLSQRIHLDGEYEVALTDIIYTNSWINFDATGMTYVLLKNSEVYKSGAFTTTYFNNEKELVESLNNQLNDPNVSFEYSESSRHILLEVGKRYGIHMSPILSEFLGFKSGGPYTRLKFAEDGIDINKGLRMFYIYSDIATYSAVGDIQAPLLRVCNVTGAHGETNLITFHTPQYIPVSRRDIETIEVDIRDELGDNFSFEYGKTLCTLHFRRINSLA